MFSLVPRCLSYRKQLSTKWDPKWLTQNVPTVWHQVKSWSVHIRDERIGSDVLIRMYAPLIHPPPPPKGLVFSNLETCNRMNIPKIKKHPLCLDFGDPTSPQWCTQMQECTRFNLQGAAAVGMSGDTRITSTHTHTHKKNSTWKVTTWNKSERKRGHKWSV